MRGCITHIFRQASQIDPQRVPRLVAFIRASDHLPQLVDEHAKAPVSDFSLTPLYANRFTYIYGAAIFSLKGKGSVGGVGIVFDSEPQFAAMLRDSLPRDTSGKIRDGVALRILDIQDLGNPFLFDRLAD